MSAEGGPAARLTPAETSTEPSACGSSLRTGGMQQQTPADTEEKRVSGFSAGSSVLLGPDAPSNLGTT